MRFEAQQLKLRESSVLGAVAPTAPTDPHYRKLRETYATHFTLVVYNGFFQSFATFRIPYFRNRNAFRNFFRDESIAFWYSL